MREMLAIIITAIIGSQPGKQLHTQAKRGREDIHWVSTQPHLGLGQGGETVTPF